MKKFTKKSGQVWIGLTYWGFHSFVNMFDYKLIILEQQKKNVIEVPLKVIFMNF